MVVRQLCYTSDEILIKQCEPVKEITPRVTELTEDVFETMHENFGAGLTASQVRVLKQVVAIGVDDGHQYVLINPEIIKGEGEQAGPEGCLSAPGKSGIVTKPQKVEVRAYDENMEQFKLEGEDLLVHCICHECAHLRSKPYVTRVEDELADVTAGDDKEEEE